VRLFARRLLAGTAIGASIMLVSPVAGARPALIEQVAGITTGPLDHADPSPARDGPALEDRPAVRTPVAQDRGVDERLPFADRPSAPSPATLEGYRWPLPNGRLTLPYGPTPWGTDAVDGEPFHDGIDLATFCGDRVVAAHDGRVLAAGRAFDDEIGWHGDLGPYRRWITAKHHETALPISVVIDDGNGYRSIYAHFSRIVVKVGQDVTAGQLIGYEGATGHATGCHLHYALFSPQERVTIGVRADVRKRLHLPAAKTARIDPLLVLPPRAGDPPPLATP
jgi:murein DD-endopeptidase MepM/ murein hydrolase activator NlpD